MFKLLHRRRNILRIGSPAILLASLAATPAVGRGHHGSDHAADIPRVALEKTGSVSTRRGRSLRATSDLGDFHIFTDASGEVRYRIRIAADSRLEDAPEVVNRYVVSARATETGVVILGHLNPRDERANVRVDWEIHVPKSYAIEISTGAGNIETQDIDGKVVLMTGGGNITAGRVGNSQGGGEESPSAHLETEGGHVVVGDVAGDLHASTEGGHITAGDVGGDAELHTGGGHIRVGSIAGDAQVETGGGNILVERAGGEVVATTGGGQISFGEVSGSIRARTAGGAIRIARATGPTEVESNRGSIVLTAAEGPLHASTTLGTITAWILPSGASSDDESATARGKLGRRVEMPSELDSAQGDIVVYLPRALGITIDASVVQGGSSHIVADPDIPIKVSYLGAGNIGPVHAECEMNGGGELLRLRAISGNIILKLSDAETAIRIAEQQMEQLRQQMDSQAGFLAQTMGPGAPTDVSPPAISGPPEPPEPPPAPEEFASRFDEFADRLEELFWGGVEVDPETQQKKLVQNVEAVYPDVARQAGIEGSVVLRLVIGKDGAVQGMKVISGEPVLAQAAMDAVEHWRYSPTLVEGRPVNVLTTVSIEFHLK